MTEATWSDFFVNILNTNGKLSSGVAGVGESPVPEKYRIPVFKNIDGTKKTTLSQRMRWARAAYERVRGAGDSAVDNTHAISVFMCIATACVGLRDKPPANFTFEDSKNFAWEGEVVFVDEDINNYDDPIQKNEVQNFALNEEEQKVAQQILTLVSAGKITWWAAGHHLGSQVTNRPNEFQGYLSKAASVIKLTNFGFSGTAERTNLYNLVHIWSTRAVLGTLYKDKKIRQVYPMPGHISGTTWRYAPGMEFVPAADLVLRGDTFGAGYAVVADAVAALRTIVPTPLSVACPGMIQAEYLMKLYFEIKDSVFEYGIGARYLTGSDKADRADRTQFQMLLTSLATWVRATRATTTLGRAAIFGADPGTMDGYSAIFDSMCGTYANIAMGGKGYNKAKLIHIMGGAAGDSGNIPSDETIRLFKKLNMAVEKPLFESYVNAAEEFEANPQEEQR